jgi:hypothetical protein
MCVECSIKTNDVRIENKLELTRNQASPVFAHQQGAATFSESTGQPGQFKLHQVVLAGLRPQNWTTRTYVGGSTAAEQDYSDVRRARGHSAVQLGLEHHDPGPVPNLGRGTDVQLAHTAAAGGGNYSPTLSPSDELQNKNAIITN